MCGILSKLYKTKRLLVSLESGNPEDEQGFFVESEKAPQVSRGP